MKKTISQRFFLSLCLMIVGCLWGSAAWAATKTLASWNFTSSSHPANKKDFKATGGAYTESTFYLNGTGSTWNSSKGYAFTAITDMSITLVSTETIPANTVITFTGDMYFNASKNAPATGYTLTVSENEATASTTGLSTTSISLSTSKKNCSVTYTTQKTLTAGSTIKLIYTQTGKKGAGQAYVNNLVASADIPSKTLSTVAVSGTPTKKTYEAGDAFEPAGLVVTGTYSDDSHATITEGITWNVTPETLTEGSTSVVVTATVDGVTSEEYTVTGLTVTAARTLASVTLEGNPTKTTYYVGETFDPTGIKVIANYTTGDPEDVTDEAIFTYDDAALTIGTTYAEVFATYNEMDSDVEKYNITVNKKASSISIANLTIGVGEISTITATTTPADAALTYTITDGNEYVTLDGNQLTGSAVGTATIKASYAGDDEYEAAETSFTVTVSDLKTATISSFSTTSGNFTNNTDISFEAFQGGGTTPPAINNSALRLYQGSPSGGYVTISGVSGVNIQSITLYTSSKYASTTIG